MERDSLQGQDITHQYGDDLKGLSDEELGGALTGAFRDASADSDNRFDWITYMQQIIAELTERTRCKPGLLITVIIDLQPTLH